MNKNLDLLGFADQYLSAPDAFPLYSLADHAGMPGLHGELVRAKSEWRSLFEGTGEAGALSVAPLLIQIDPRSLAGRGLLRWLSEHGTFSSTLLFVASPLLIDQLASRLAKRLEARISEDSDVLLRFYDPRIFEQLLNILIVEQRQSFLCCATKWWFVSRRGELYEESAKCALVDSFVPPLRLSAIEEFALLDASESDQVVEQLQAALPDLYSAIPLSMRYDFVTRHVAEARERKISATHELALYCAMALTMGDDFSSIPEWDQILRRVSAGEVRLADGLAQFDA